MSYILDALRRADAERERDPARGIHAQTGAGTPARRRTSLPGWAWPAIGALLVVGVAVAWLQRPVAEPAAPPVQAARVAPAVPAPVLVPVADTVRPAPPPMPAAPDKPRVALAPATPLPPSRPASPPAAAATPAPASASPAAAAAAAPAASTAPGADRIYNVAELPADVRQGLPRLAISGGVYSENPAQRMLVVGGQVVSEGAELAPGVVLEQIRARTAVLRSRGYRYSVSY